MENLYSEKCPNFVSSFLHYIEQHHSGSDICKNSGHFQLKSIETLKIPWEHGSNELFEVLYFWGKNWGYPPRGGHLWGLEGQLLLILDVGRLAHHTNHKKNGENFFAGKWIGIYASLSVKAIPFVLIYLAKYIHYCCTMCTLVFMWKSQEIYH